VKIKDFSIYFYFGGMPLPSHVSYLGVHWISTPKDFCFELAPLPKILDPPLQPGSKQSLKLTAHAE